MSDFERLGWRPEDHPRLSPDELEGELGRVVTAGRHQRARRRAAIGGALAVASILTVASVATLRSPDNADVRMVDVPTTTTPTTVGEPSVDTVVPPTGVPTTTKPAPPRPPFVVVTREAGSEDNPQEEILVLDAQSGKPLRTIFRADFGDIQSISLAPDGKHVYFVVEGCGDNPIYRVSVDGPAGQKGEVVVRGTAAAYPVVSPDGRLLAYLAQKSCDEIEGDGSPEWEVRVRDLTTGNDRLVGSGAKQYQLTHPTWSADGKSLAVSADRMDVATFVEAFVAVLDPGKQQDVLAAPRVTSKRDGFGFRSPTYLPDGNLFVIETPLGAKVGSAPALMLVVGGRSGAPVRQVATGDPKKAYHRTDADPTGAHLLYMSATDHNDPGELRVSSNGARTTVLADGVTEGTW